MSENQPRVGDVLQHYKGKKYEVLALARHSETLDHLVVYRGLYEPFHVWCRPVAMFQDTVTYDSKAVPRFKNLGAPGPDPDSA